MVVITAVDGTTAGKKCNFVWDDGSTSPEGCSCFFPPTETDTLLPLSVMSYKFALNAEMPFRFTFI